MLEVTFGDASSLPQERLDEAAAEYRHRFKLPYAGDALSRDDAWAAARVPRPWPDGAVAGGLAARCRHAARLRRAGPAGRPAAGPQGRGRVSAARAWCCSPASGTSRRWSSRGWWPYGWSKASSTTMPPASVAPVTTDDALASCSTGSRSSEAAASNRRRARRRAHQPQLPGARDDGGDYVVRVSETSTGLLAIDRATSGTTRGSPGSPGWARRWSRRCPTTTCWWSGSWADAPSAPTTSATTRPSRASPRRCALHLGGAFQGDFDMRSIRRHYLSVVQERGFRLPEDYLVSRSGSRRSRTRCAPGGEPLVPCNNDLLAANFIDDGTQDLDHRLRVLGDERGQLRAREHRQRVRSRRGGDGPAREHLLGAGVPAEAGPGARLVAARSLRLDPVGRRSRTAARPIDFDFWSWGMVKYDSAHAELLSRRYDEILLGLSADD